MSAHLTTVEQHHRRHHAWRVAFDSHVSEAVDECWRCQRAAAHCRTKRVFPDRETAAEAALSQNVEMGWVRPVYAYRCRWCPGLHLATAKRTEHRKRVEKQRRKWLVRSLVA